MVLIATLLLECLIDEDDLLHGVTEFGAGFLDKAVGIFAGAEALAHIVNLLHGVLADGLSLAENFDRDGVGRSSEGFKIGSFAGHLVRCRVLLEDEDVFSPAV